MMSASTAQREPSRRKAVSPQPGAVPWRNVVLPAEHGGWGLSAEPVLLGLLLAPSPAGVCLGLATFAAFLSRHPLRLVLMDRRKDVYYPRTKLAGRVFVSEALLALLFLGAAFMLRKAAFWPALLAAAPLAIAALLHDGLGRSREAAAEATGGVALSSATAAIALAGGAPWPLAFAAWALLAFRAVTSVLYVRARIRLDRGLPSGIRPALSSHAAALAVMMALASTRLAPWLAVVAFAVLLARATYGLSRWRRHLRPQQLGFQELGFGVLTLILASVGYLAGL